MDKDRRYRSRIKLQHVVKKFGELPAKIRTKEVFFFGTDAAGLDREFVTAETQAAIAVGPALAAGGDNG